MREHDERQPEPVTPDSLPSGLADALGSMYGAQPGVDRAALDQAVLSHAESTLRRASRHRRFAEHQVWISVAAAALGLGVTVWTVLSWTPTHQPPQGPVARGTPSLAQPTLGTQLQREALADAQGFDVVDVHAVALQVKSGAAVEPRWDADGDGTVGQADIVALLSDVVRLEGS